MAEHRLARRIGGAPERVDPGSLPGIWGYADDERKVTMQGTPRWIHEAPSYWDRDKARIVGGAVAGALAPSLVAHEPGEVLPGDWWRVEVDGKTVGYGVMDVTWGDAEISVVVDRDEQRRGIGSFILDRLEQAARERGVNYLYNVVNPEHPQREELIQWLRARNFVGYDDGRLHRAVLRKAASADR